MPRLFSRASLRKVQRLGQQAKQAAIKQTVSLEARRMLRALAQHDMPSPRNKTDQALLARLISRNLAKQTESFPARFSISDTGKAVLAQVESQTKLRGVSTTLTINESKAIAAINSASREGLPVAGFTKVEKQIINNLLKRRLIVVSEGRNPRLQVTKLGKLVLAEQKKG